MENTFSMAAEKNSQTGFKTGHDMMFRSYQHPGLAKPPLKNDLSSNQEQYSLQDQQQLHQIQSRMYGSTMLFDRNAMTTSSYRSKIQKSVILFSNDSGISLGDLEQMKISNMKEIQKETKILAEEIGENIDDKQFKDILKDECTTKRLSIRLSDSALVQFRQEQQTDIFPLQEIKQPLELNEVQIALQKQSSSTTQNSQENDSLPLQKSPTSSENDMDEEDEILQITEDGQAQQVPIIDIAEKQIASPQRRASMKNEQCIALPPLISMKGFLKKRSPKYLMGWQKRWCVLKDQKFFYFKNEAAFRQLGCISFNIISTQAELIEGKKSKRKKLLLKFSGCDKTFIFKSSDPAQPIEMWYGQVVNHIKQSKGHFMEMRLTTKQFWRDDRISLSDFQGMADTGDLILFRGKAFEAKLQRAVTGSEFDHVAIVLKYSTSDIFIMEALGGKIGKVILFRWSLFQKNKWFEFYDKIVYRKLSMQRTSQVLTQLEGFIQYALNKKYKFTLGKIMRKKTSEKEESESNDKRTFFCSELVASVYKKLGILNEATASSAYLPGDFSLERNLKLMNEAKLSHEQVIDFSMVS